MLPTLLITPESQRLLTDGGRLRRRMMDWALFHVEPGYNVLLQRYRLSLRQRNACLRQQSPYAALTAWTKELETHAIELHRMRSRFAEEVRPSLDEMIGGLLGREVEVRYRPGWNTEEPLSVRLERSLQSDLSRGHTGYGPHRADIRFTVDGSPAQHVLSRGEAKLFVAAVLLAQTSYVVSRAIQVPVVLMDDLPSELDAVNRSRLLGALMACNAQVFLTTVSRDLLETGEWEAKKMFHVEQGSVCEMV